MNKLREGKLENVRLVKTPRGAQYCGMGTTAFVKWSKSIGAYRKMGRSVFHDLDRINAELDRLAKESAETV